MKKLISFLLTSLILAGLFTLSVTASDADVSPVYVTISDENGELVLAYEAFELKDYDGDGKLTVNDALLAAHQSHCEGGYASNSLNITKLWGVENRVYDCYIDGSRMYYIYESLSEDNHIQAFVYTDTENLSDRFSYFTKETLTFSENTETLALYAYTTTKDGHLISEPVAGAKITVNGEEIGVKTDQNGQFTIALKDLVFGEKNIISAIASNDTLVPPVLAVTPDESMGSAAPAMPTLIWLILIVVVLLAAAFGIRTFLFKRKHKHNHKRKHK